MTSEILPYFGTETIIRFLIYMNDEKIFMYGYSVYKLSNLRKVIM
jgi:hypothetical protein